MKILVVSDKSHKCIFYTCARTHLHKNTIASLNVSLAEPVHTKQSFMLTSLKSPPVLRAIKHHFIPSTRGLGSRLQTLRITFTIGLQNYCLKVIELWMWHSFSTSNSAVGFASFTVGDNHDDNEKEHSTAFAFRQHFIQIFASICRL